MTQYVTVAQVQTYLGIADTVKDAVLIGELITRATNAIEAETGRLFKVSADTTRYFNPLDHIGEDRQTLYFDYDLCQITTVTNNEGEAVASTEYKTLPRNSTPWFAIRLKDNSDVDWDYTTDPEDAIAITGRWGYSVTPPDDIAHACVRLTAWLYRQKDNQIDLDRPAVGGEGLVLMPARIPEDVKAMIRHYKPTTSRGVQ